MKTSETAEFWADDAAAIAERERVQRTGHRMPAAAKQPNERPTTRPQPQYQAKPFTDLDDAAKRRQRVLIITSFAAAAIATVSVWTWYTWPVVTLKEFNSLTNGMTVEECTKVIGAEGTIVLESAMPEEFRKSGVPFVDVTDMRQWHNSDGSNTVVVFVDGKAFCKVQIGLK